MNQTFIDIVFEGKRFSPRKLKELTGFNIESIAESGEVATRGRYKGNPFPYGLGLLKISGSAQEDINVPLAKTVKALLKQREALHISAVEDITLDLENFSEKELEITIDKDLIKLISELNANIDFSSIVDSDSKKLKTNRDSYYWDYNQTRFIDELYFMIISENMLKENLSNVQADRLRNLFYHKIDHEKIIQFPISQNVFTTLLFYYVIKYLQEEDLNKIPTFDKVLKESLS